MDEEGALGAQFAQVFADHCRTASYDRSGSTIAITCLTLSGCLVTIELLATAPICDLFFAVAEKLGVDVENLQLAHREGVLSRDGDLSLEESGVTEGAILTVVLTPPFTFGRWDERFAQVQGTKFTKTGGPFCSAVSTTPCLEGCHRWTLQNVTGGTGAWIGVCASDMPVDVAPSRCGTHCAWFAVAGHLFRTDPADSFSRKQCQSGLSSLGDSGDELVVELDCDARAVSFFAILGAPKAAALLLGTIGGLAAVPYHLFICMNAHHTSWQVIDW